MVRQPQRTRISPAAFKNDKGPFDIIGDVHGCLDELRELLGKLGYSISRSGIMHKAGRRAVFLGDLANRGPDVPGVLRLVIGAVSNGAALCVAGNQDMELVKKLKGQPAKSTAGLRKSVEQLEGEPAGFIARTIKFLESLPGHFVLDSGRLVAAHAGMKKELIGSDSDEARRFAICGELAGDANETSLAKRIKWAAEYRGRAKIVYGHKPVIQAKWLGNTINIDTGCVYGGKLTALRYPGMRIVSVQAKKVYSRRGKPFFTVP